MKKKIVIIGGGLAGSLLCNELVKDHEVTLLERGSKNTIQFPRVHFVKKKFAEVNTFCYGGGGTTNLWHNGLIPINPQDITCQEFREVLIDAQSFIDQAASALFFDKKAYTAEHQKLVAEVNSLSERFSAFPHGIDCLIYPKKFSKLTVAPQVHDVYDVAGIGFVPWGGKIKTVNYSTGRQQHSVDADIVIVAAGTLGTPEILQKIIAATGAPFDKVGVGFIDHPMGFVGKVKFKKNIAETIKKLSSYDKGDYVSRNAIRLKSECGRYTAGAFFRPALTMDNNLAIYKFKSSLGASNGMARLKNAFSWKLFHPDMVAEIFAHLFGVSIPSRTYNILFIAEQKRGSNRVYWEGGELQVDWSISSDEIAIYRKMLDQLKDMLSGLADGINIETGISDDWLWSAAHHSCTSPLGDTADDLIDRDLKLKFCDNVFVCDGSVIQEHSYANTGLAIGQLAFRLARRIRDAGQG
jgi:hypothetical protein